MDYDLWAKWDSPPRPHIFKVRSKHLDDLVQAFEECDGLKELAIYRSASRYGQSVLIEIVVWRK